MEGAQAGSGIGELAALGTAFCWTLSSLFFTASAKRIGSLALNFIRLAQAFLFLAVFGYLWRGMALPTDVGSTRAQWLFWSGIVGFVFGDLCLFRAFVLVGPRISTLLMALAPPIAALSAWMLLDDDRLDALGWLGMALTMAGVVWVVFERQASLEEKDRSHLTKGVLLAFGGAVGQGLGAALGKKGMLDYDPFAATQVRILAGLAGFAMIFFAVRWWPKVWESLKHPSGMGYSFLGAVFGPFLGVSLFMLSLKHTQTGVTSTIAATVPVLILPFVILIHKERVSFRAIFGAVLAVAGVALLYLPNALQAHSNPPAAVKADSAARE